MLKYFYFFIILLFFACSETSPSHFWTEDIQAISSVKNPRGCPIETTYFKGENVRGNHLFIAEIQGGDVTIWLQNTPHQVVHSEEGELYEYEREGKKYFAYFTGNKVLYAAQAYMIEDALRCQRGAIPSLQETFPAVATLSEKQQYFTLATLQHPLLQNIKELEKARVVGAREDSTHLFAGQLFVPHSYSTSEYTSGLDFLRIIPSDATSFGLYNYQAKFQGESVDYQHYINFNVQDVLKEESVEFVALKYLENPEGIIKKWAAKYAILSEKNTALSYTITQFSHSFFQETPFVTTLKNPYMVVIEDYIIFCEKLRPLESYISSYIANQTLLFSPQINTFPRKWKPSPLKGSVHYVKEKNTIQWVNCYATENPSIFDINIYTTQDTTQQAQENVTWVEKKELSAFPISFLQTLPHAQQNWMITQDEKHLVKVWDENINEVFSRYLDGEILGDIFHFKDKTTQLDRYVFNTATSVYIWNEKGENLHDFPLKMTTSLQGGIQGIDLPTRRAVLGFLIDKNGRLTAYDLNKGLQPLPSWNPYMGDKITSRKVAILQGDDELHFAFINDKNEFISLDRKAKRRFPPLKIEPEFVGKIQVDANKKGRERFVLHNGKGKLKIINTQGEVFHIQVGTGKGAFLLVDIQGDSQKEYVSLLGSQVRIYTYVGNVLEVQEIKQPFQEALTLKTPTQSYLGAINEKDQLWIYDSKSQQFQDYIKASPLTTLLARKGKAPLLLTILDNELWVYLVTLK